MQNSEVVEKEEKAQVAKWVTNSFPVIGMTCAACASSVESILVNTAGVKSANVNFAASSVLITHDSGIAHLDLQNALQSVGYDLLVDVEDPEELLEHRQKLYFEEVQQRTIWSALLTLPVFIIGMFYMDWAEGRWISMVLSIPILFWFGRSFYINAWKQAKHGKTNMDTLVVLSTSVAFVFSVFNTLFPEFWHSRG
ncbi:MAG: cation transporter, partial [Cryomorphaceae bacterium]